MQVERLHARVRTLETADAPMSGARSVGVLDAPPHMGGGGGRSGGGSGSRHSSSDGIRVMEEDDISLDGGSSEEDMLDADGSPLRRSHNESIPTLALGAVRKGVAGEEEGSGFHQAFVAEAPNFSDSWREGLEADQRGASSFLFLLRLRLQLLLFRVDLPLLTPPRALATFRRPCHRSRG